jgi:uncharacterized protein (TIGR02300 family)
LSKPELGMKRQCQNCGAKFFDLGRNPIVCPKCGTAFQGVARAASVKDEDDDSEIAAPAGVDVVSLDEVGASEEKAVEAVVGEIDVEDDGADAEESFLEEEEEDDDDVTNLIDGDIAPDEES